MTESQQAAINQAAKEILDGELYNLSTDKAFLVQQGSFMMGRLICTNPEKYGLVSKVKYDNDVLAFVHDIEEIFKSHIPLSEALEFAEWAWYNVPTTYRGTVTQLWGEFQKQKQ